MYLIVGLGNPGIHYQNTRHNLGQSIISQVGKLKPQAKFQASVLTLGDKIFATPSTFMNLSSNGVQPLLNFYKIPTSNLYIIHDDLDLPVGEYRLQFDRGPAGHKGVDSIITALGSQAFWRFRVGIGHPPATIPVEDFVLQPFLATEKPLIAAITAKILTDLHNLGS